jgi:pyridoxal phosphate enzyme (YggS family)
MIAENLRLVKEEIAGKCAEIGRNPAEITLIAVSKNFGIEDINEAFTAGQLHFGENRVQELQHKYEHFSNNITWHLIGTLQRNKVKFAVQSAEYIHSVDSLQLASEISKRAENLGKVQKILLQLKTSGEETKAGFEDIKEFFKTVQFCRESKNLDLKGLMTIAPFTDDASLVRKSFRTLRELRDDLNSKGFEIKELSMGMTGDFKIALEEGATMLRIGSAIFGKRDYSKSRKEI